MTNAKERLRGRLVNDVITFHDSKTRVRIRVNHSVCCADSEDIPTAKHLLQRIVPLGSMPSLPDGFPSLSQLKTDRFYYSINKGKVTVTADLEDPVSLFGSSMKVHDVTMTFRYNKAKPSGKWRFNAEGKKLRV